VDVPSEVRVLKQVRVLRLVTSVELADLRSVGMAAQASLDGTDETSPVTHFPPS